MAPLLCARPADVHLAAAALIESHRGPKKELKSSSTLSAVTNWWAPYLWRSNVIGDEQKQFRLTQVPSAPPRRDGLRAKQDDDPLAPRDG